MAKTITNRYAGSCSECGGRVEPGAGTATKLDGRWVTKHDDCSASAASAEAATVASAPASVGFDPTPEQEEAIEMFRSGENLAIEAGAGTGKTSTLILLARSTRRSGQYVAFNRSIVQEAKRKMPANVAAATAHSLAFAAVGRPFKARLDSQQRVRSMELARLLDVDSIKVTYGAETKTLAAGFLAGQVMKAVANFCQSADEAIETRHFSYIEGIDVARTEPDGRVVRGYANNEAIRRALLPTAEKAWLDVTDPNGRLPFRHEHYLKLWERSEPKLGVDFVLFDEAQDASPVMLSIVSQQTDTQLVFVGDSQQQIYEFTGAVNALAKVPAERRTFLTQSFRFGQGIASMANEVLESLDADLRIVGTSEPSFVGGLPEPSAILTRTNAEAVRRLLDSLAAGRRVFLLGGGAEVVRFAKAAERLQAGESTDHPDLACFSSWGEVQEYVIDDPQGEELKLLVALLDEYGVGTIIEALDATSDEATADVVVSTAHKAKGREWDDVALGGDFKIVRPGDEPQRGERESSPAELRLLYVAVTRAKKRLDIGSTPFFRQAGAKR